MRRLVGIVAGFALVGAALGACSDAAMPTSPASDASARVAELHHSPTCTCCTEYAAYLRRNGWSVEVIEEQDVSAFQAAHGVPQAARSCHTTLIEGYVIEGHVPLAAVERLLSDRPPIDGIALPGMPLGSPGMSGEADGPLAVVAFDADGRVEPYGEY